VRDTSIQKVLVQHLISLEAWIIFAGVDPDLERIDALCIGRQGYRLASSEVDSGP
jgi:hypothetical protein